MVAIVCSVIAFAHAESQELTGSAKWADSARREIEIASISGDTLRLATAERMLERAMATFPNDALLLHYEGYAYYRMAELDRPGGGKRVGDLLGKAEDALAKSSKRKPMAETSALLSSVHGQMIAAGANFIRTMRLGMRSSGEMKNAVALAPNNPRVVMLRGVNSIFTPKMWGGGVDKAETDLLGAIKLFEADSARAPLPSWGKGEAYAWLGQVYQLQNRITDARAAYQRALSIEPGYVWVRQVLLPSLGSVK